MLTAKVKSQKYTIVEVPLPEAGRTIVDVSLHHASH
jgi:hypothetical protein